MNELLGLTLVEIAHPDFREELRAATRGRK